MVVYLIVRPSEACLVNVEIMFRIIQVKGFPGVQGDGEHGVILGHIKVIGV